MIVTVWCGCSTPSPNTKVEGIFHDTVMVEIYNAAHRRDTASLINFLKHETPAYRMTASKLLGSLPSENCPSELLEALMDPIPYVRLYSAFSVGQYRDEKSLPNLEKAFKKATIPEIKAELLKTIGKCADDNAMEFLVLHNPNTSIEESGKMDGVFQGALKGLLKKDHVRMVVAHLRANEPETRMMAAQILARQKTVDLNSFLEEIEQAYFQETIPETRAIILRALIAAGAGDTFLVSVLKNESDPALLSSAIYGLKEPLKHQSLLEEFLIGERPWTASAAAYKLAEIDTLQLSRASITAAFTTDIPEVAAVVYRSLLDVDREEASSFYAAIAARFNNPVKQSVLFNAYSHHPEGLDSLKKYMFLDDPIGTASWRSYTLGCERFPLWRRTYEDMAMTALDNGLSAQTVMIAQSLRNPIFRSVIKAEALRNALKRFEDPEDIEVRVELLATLEEEYGILVEPEPLTYYPLNWDEIRGLGKKVIMDVYVNGSKISLELLPEDAPASVSQVVRLAEEGFYDGTFFHRVVPGFVTQGGGPRGDGYGSHSDILRSELSELSYGKGVVGLASAGPDTESCQFFITHLPTPHLDGRYTIIGATRDNTDFIETGAVMDSVRVRR